MQRFGCAPPVLRSLRTPLPVPPRVPVHLRKRYSSLRPATAVIGPCRQPGRAAAAAATGGNSGHFTKRRESTLLKPDSASWVQPVDLSGTQERLASCRGKIAVVTGGARGIGAQIALGLAEAGAIPAIFDILDEPVAAEFAPILKACPQTKYYKTDVSSPDSVAASYKAVISDFNRVDICVAAAGLIRETAFVDVPQEELALQTQVNINGVFNTVQQAAKQMISQGTGGSLLVIASIASHRALRGQLGSVYIMTKCAVRGLVKQVAIELGQYGIRINSLSPGYVQTKLAVEIATPEKVERWNAASPLGRMERPDELKAPAVFLCSDAASFVTGTDLLVDGGATT
ncbi:hypothetical protein QBC33DRAFT_502251 [Phialemonium atrogriseum]|uniref:NAD(P)-binding protein n=1 Tax=Phialemonium atrogriseum TaxID=1093897 RepID=A0AAJ0BRR1_9PEZI|nr:uncharacterized protein QBC33DRAFT_502251 [Phialemonium atrogriseum]KAK1761812.1 hypothetical protein QBC33DRAFT_502251 [Phialemonium atrogriseum]